MIIKSYKIGTVVTERGSDKEYIVVDQRDSDIIAICKKYHDTHTFQYNDLQMVKSKIGEYNMKIPYTFDNSPAIQKILKMGKNLSSKQKKMLETVDDKLSYILSCQGVKGTNEIADTRKEKVSDLKFREIVNSLNARELLKCKRKFEVEGRNIKFILSTMEQPDVLSFISELRTPQMEVPTPEINSNEVPF